MLRNWGSFYITIIIGLLLALMAIVPPAPQSTDIALDKFSSGRAMTDVKIIAAEPHPTGSPENAKVREYLKSRLESLGLEVKELSLIHISEPTRPY